MIPSTRSSHSSPLRHTTQARCARVVISIRARNDDRYASGVVVNVPVPNRTIMESAGRRRKQLGRWLNVMLKMRLHCGEEPQSGHILADALGG